MSLAPVNAEMVKQAIVLLASEMTTDQVLKHLTEITNDSITAERLTTWVSEAFGRLIVGRQPGVRLLEVFLATTTSGQSRQIPISKEPIYALAFAEAVIMLESVHAEQYQRIADRSAIVAAASNAMASGVSLEGAVFAGPSLLGIPAEAYDFGHPAQQGMLVRWLRRLTGSRSDRS